MVGLRDHTGGENFQVRGSFIPTWARGLLFARRFSYFISGEVLYELESDLVSAAAVIWELWELL